MKSLFILFVLCAIGLTACTGSKQAVSDEIRNYVGSNQSAIYQKLGPPTYTTEDGKGGKILVYAFTHEGPVTPGQYSYQNNNIYVPDGNGGIRQSGPGTLTYTPPQQSSFTMKLLFYVGTDNIIYFTKAM